MTTLRAFWRPALMLIALVAALLILRESGLDPRGAVAAAGSHGPGAFFLIATTACAFAVPRQAIAFAAGYAFGFWLGGGLALAAELSACALNFAWARLAAREAALRILSRRNDGRLARLDRFLSDRAFTATLTLRLLPVGNNLLLNLLAGVSGVAAAPFLVASLIGYIPQTAIFALAGVGAEVSDGVRYASAAALLLASAGLGMLLLRRSSLQRV